MNQQGCHLISQDMRIEYYIDAAQRLARGDFRVYIPVDDADSLGQLGCALDSLAQSLEYQYQELQRLDAITTHINAGLMLDEIMARIYADFRQIIPYNRIGLSLIEDGTVSARWLKSESDRVQITKGYSAPLAGSSLETIMQTGQPRIINDMVAYLEHKPQSMSTRAILAEGVLSSLTCPLKMNGVPIGFLFFSSFERNTYQHVHIDLFQKLAGQVSVIVEKGKLVTELAQQKETIERKNQELEKLNTLKDTILGMVSHDLRSPLAIMQMGLDVLTNMPDLEFSDAERSEIMGDMHHQINHMLLLIDDLLNMSELETGRLSLTLKQFSLDRYLNNLIQRHQQIAAVKGTCIKLENCMQDKAVADVHRLRQVVDNLISNAVKYSPPNSLIRVRTLCEPDSWGVAVIDEGPGITVEDRKKLFQKFGRLSAKPTGGESSTGLGLAISQRIIEAHQGLIGVDSIPGNGATFWFRIPYDLPVSNAPTLEEVQVTA